MSANNKGAHSRVMKIIVLEDEPQMLDRIVGILKGWTATSRVIGCATNAEFSKIIEQEKDIDVLLADLKLPDGDGCDSIRLISRKIPQSVSIVISSMSDGPSVCAAIYSGAVGYMHKDDSSLSIIRLIEDACAGLSPMSPSIAKTLFSQIQRGELKSQEMTISQSAASKLLTPRQIEVLETIAKGFSYEETAQVLGISKNTIPTHVRNIYRKLQSNNKSEAIYEARQLGIIE